LVLNLLGAGLLSGCALGPTTHAPVQSMPAESYADASTPIGMIEYNGGYIDDVTIKGRPYSVLTDDGAAKVAKWQGSQKGFVHIHYNGHLLWAVDKAVIFSYINH
jgi:hypothetical protein